MMKRRLVKVFIALVFLTSVFVLNYFIRIDFSWRQRSAEAGTAADGSSGPKSAIHFEQTRSDVNLEEETYILYSDLDQDGDLDIAYTTNSPIRFIENKTIERKKN